MVPLSSYEYVERRVEARRKWLKEIAYLRHDLASKANELFVFCAQNDIISA